MQFDQLILQEKLVGPPFRESEWGTGMIPKAAIAGVATSRGIPAAIDTVNVRHISGGLSSLQFKSYERGREFVCTIARTAAFTRKATT